MSDEETTGRPSSVKPAAPASSELSHLGQLAALRALGDGGEEADGHLGLGLGPLDERTEHCGRVDHRLRVGHGEDGAEAPPAAAARVPEAIVSSSSRPGVRRWT